MQHAQDFRWCCIFQPFWGDAAAYLHDDLEVGNHHGHPAEQRLEVFGQLLPAGVAGVHRDEEPADGLEEDVLRVARELEKLHARFLGVLDRQHLRGERARRGVSQTVQKLQLLVIVKNIFQFKDVGTSLFSI